MSVGEGNVIAAIRQFFRTGYGNGPKYVVLPHVRNAAGFDASRTADVIVMGLWPSEGLPIHGIEVKVLRSDWLREMKNPQKAAGWHPIVDYWWVAASSPAIVAAAELPTTTGLMVLHGNTMRIAVSPKRLREEHSGERIPVLPPGLGRSALASLLRAAVYAGRAEQRMDDGDNRAVYAQPTPEEGQEK